MEDRYLRQFKKGSLEMILLSLMADGETYGYEIITRLNRHGGVMGVAREGTIYPILYRLEENGLVRCRVAPAPANGGSRKYYSLTPLGGNTLQELAAFWESYSRCVEEFLEPVRAKWKEAQP